MLRKLIFGTVSTVLLLVGLVIVSAARTQAGQLSQTMRPLGDMDKVSVDHWLQPATARSAFAPTQIAAPAYSEWSKIVFQSYRDSNWEIYIARGDGSSQTRLTAHPASDIYPRLNRGGTRIVFVSNRTGNNEIFLMNPDGSGVNQLTFTSANEYNPSWLPDSTKIAFNSYRDGQSEIYVMNADGSEQTRLTNNAGYDGNPAWSPDGKRIAFISDRSSPASTGSRIWVMNADGSAPIQMSTQYYSENPNWSPDGSQIAYDTDDNNDGSQEIWLMNGNGSNQHQVYDPPNEPTLGYPGYTDAWVRGWSPDGGFVTFTRITFLLYQGNWYWYTAYPDALDTATFNIFDLIVGQGEEWYPDWQTLDIKAPISSMSALPTYSRNPVMVTWSGQDRGVAGLRNYDIQYKDGDTGDWIDWLRGTSTTSATFAGVLGHHYHFRNRARDNASNVEDWHDDSGDAYTTLYAWEVKGTVRDNRDTPVMGAIITTTPEALAMFPSDDSGALSTCVAVSTTAYEAAWRKDGYGSLPSVKFNAVPDGYLDAVLPPADNAVLNGGFEVAGGTLTGWDWSGEFTPTVRTDTSHTGLASVFLGLTITEVTLTEPEAIGGGIYSYPDITVDHQGTAHVVYAQTFSGIFYYYRTITGTWVGPTPVGTYGNWSTAVFPRVAVAPAGDIHAVWYGEQGIYYNHASNGSWVGQTVIGPEFPLVGNDYCQEQDVAIDSQGGLHLVYYCWHSYQQEVYYSHRLPDGTWLPTEFLGSGRSPQITLGPDDMIYVWYGGFYRARAPGGNWSPNTPLPCGDQMVVSQDGTLHAVCSGTYVNKPRGLPWSNPVPVSKYHGGGSLAVDSEGTLYLVNTSGYVYEEGTYFHYRLKNGQWSEPEIINGDYHCVPIVVADHSDNIHMIYEGEWSANHYRTNIKVPDSAVSTISQTIVVPSNLYSPTLSFFYRLSGANPGVFNVSLSDGLVSTSVFSTTHSSNWTHSWVDLSPWTSQIITMVMSSQTITGGNYTRLYLDEISIGSAYPDLWVNMNATPASVLTGKQVVYTINYGNRGGTPAEGVWITDSLPSELQFVDANPIPTSAGSLSMWNVGTLPAASGPFRIVITATVAPTATALRTTTNTASIGATSPELETANNASLATVFVGHRLYLPVVGRE